MTEYEASCLAAWDRENEETLRKAMQEYSQGVSDWIRMETKESTECETK